MRRPGALGAVVAGGLLLLLTLSGTPVSLAAFVGSSPTSAAFVTGSLAPPTSLAGTGGAQASLAWTPSTSTAASGYTLLRSATPGSGYLAVAGVTPVAASTATDSPGTGTWFYVLETILGGWTSALSNEAAVTVAVGTTGLVGCTANAAETAAAGDNNGYETNPGNACAQDGAVAVDAASGTNASTSCADSGKDRHRFWGYAFGLPLTVKSVAGISVQLRAGLNNSGGTTLMCVQLSWDGGTSWTAARTVTPVNTMTTFLLGGATDGWGRSWSPAELNPATFRVRITDVSSQTTKAFSLDWVGVEVSYTP